MTAARRPVRVILAAAVMLVGAALWGAHHIIAAAAGIPSPRLAYIYLITFLALVWQVGSAYLERPHTVTPDQQTALDALRVVAVVPVYNEDPDALRACLASLLAQTRLPQMVYVVDDGSTAAEYGAVERWLRGAARAAGVQIHWSRMENSGKRWAQSRAFHTCGAADVFLTTDSDTVFDPDALAELLKPLADERVSSVAGIVMAPNCRRSLLTRITDLWFVAGQLTDRSALSVFGSVWVNSGPIAVYRAGYIRDAIPGYLAETFLGRPVPFSDDSWLTLQAMLHGRTVQQPTAYCWSLMPETFSHHRRQYLRWMRGSTIRSMWRNRYLPLRRYAYWVHLQRWASMILSSAAALYVWTTTAAGRHWQTLGWVVLVTVAVGYAQTLRYLTVRRSDQPLPYQVRTWLLAPLAVAWAATVLRVWRWYGVVTCYMTGKWGTRQSVEVTAVAA